MSSRASQKTYAAFCEEFDENANCALPETRKVANVAAKRSNPHLRPLETTNADGASDSGYSSRTVATIGSGDSLASGTRSPAYTLLDTKLANRDISRPRGRHVEEKREKTKVKGKDKEIREGKSSSSSKTMQTTIRNPAHPPPNPRSSSKSRSSRQQPCTCWDCDKPGGYHQAVMSTPVDHRAMDFTAYLQQHSHGYDVPPSPQTSRYPAMVTQDQPPRPPPSTRSQRSQSFSQHRPASFHSGMMPDMNMNMMYMPMPPPTAPTSYDHGPPLSASAYTNAPSYMSSPYMGGGPPTPHASHTPYESSPQLKYERQRAPSASRSPDKPPSRRSSNYGPAVVDYHTTPTAYYNDNFERRSSREIHGRRQSVIYHDHDPDEDYYRMPPPPAPSSKKKPAPQVIPIPRRPSARKAKTSAATPTVSRAPPSSFDLNDLRDALPPRMARRESREPISPERDPSGGRHRVRTTSYHDPTHAARVSVESSRRRRSSVYGNMEQQLGNRDLDQKQREVEEYQASRNGSSRASVPSQPYNPIDSLVKARHSQRADSDSGSQRSQTESSRGSDAKTKNSSGVSRPDDDSITMIIRGVKIDLSTDSVEGKKINVRSGEEGGVELNIEGRRPKKYLLARSDSLSTASRRELLEDARRVRDIDSKSDRASRRSSRSGYSGRGLLE
ncbi:hypothetical protein AJ80_06845 [Polytolypa hystricis UAMH7299]|uniref:Uncharacterized protein n=1 Tax=Polytolypa hystricis (strain UAMH7299) TaxID=1447883 RepID=A0A2B7XK58_POLH7|nr:hypothetical protein AJ80_06845 [Polytolypa hystricis UAMH7299]